jgi:hypothetical protein
MENLISEIREPLFLTNFLTESETRVSGVRDRCPLPLRTLQGFHFIFFPVVALDFFEIIEWTMQRESFHKMNLHFYLELYCT